MKSNKTIIYIFFLWLVLSIITAFIYYTHKEPLRWIDIPAHIAGGLLIASIIFAVVGVKSPQKALLLAFLPFIGWELFEFGMTLLKNQIFINLFSETIANRVQDLSMDVLGFMIFLIATKRKL
jgi:hypothetical protein